MEVKAAVNSQRVIWFIQGTHINSFISELAFNMEQKDGLFAVQIFAGMLQ